MKKTVLRMIPYGLYVLPAKGKDDTVAAAGRVRTVPTADEGCHVRMLAGRVI